MKQRSLNLSKAPIQLWEECYFGLNKKPIMSCHAF